VTQTKRVLKSMGTRVWQLSTTALFLGFPLMVEWDREQAVEAADRNTRDLLSAPM